MGTPYDVVYESFLDKVKEDVEFFEYKGVTVKESQELILKQCHKYLREACVRIAHSLIEYDRDMLSRDEATKTFDIELNDIEVDIIASVMYEKHLEKGLAEFKAINTFLFDSDVSILNPTSERNSYQKFVNSIIDRNSTTISDLQSVSNGKMKLPNYDER